MNRSISLIGPTRVFDDGQRGLLGRVEGPVRRPGSPCSTHRRRVATWSAVSCLPLFLGGMCRSGSSLSIRATRSLSSGLPGTIVRPPSLSLANAPSLVSSRRLALRALSSGPWQAKQLSDEDRPDVACEIDRASTGFAAWEPGRITLGTGRMHNPQDQENQRDSQTRRHAFPLAPARFSRSLSDRRDWSGRRFGNRAHVQKPGHDQRLSQGVPRRATFQSARSGSPGCCGVVRSHGTRLS